MKKSTLKQLFTFLRIATANSIISVVYSVKQFVSSSFRWIIRSIVNIIKKQLENKTAADIVKIIIITAADIVKFIISAGSNFYNFSKGSLYKFVKFIIIRSSCGYNFCKAILYKFINFSLQLYKFFINVYQLFRWKSLAIYLLYFFKGIYYYLTVIRPYLYKAFEKEMLISLVIVVTEYILLIYYKLKIAVLSVYDKNLLLLKKEKIIERMQEIIVRINSRNSYYKLQKMLKEYHLRDRKNRFFEKNYLLLAINRVVEFIRNYSSYYIIFLTVLKDFTTLLMLKFYIVILILKVFFFYQIKIYLLTFLLPVEYQFQLLNIILVVVIISVIIKSYKNTLEKEIFSYYYSILSNRIKDKPKKYQLRILQKYSFKYNVTLYYIRTIIITIFSILFKLVFGVRFLINFYKGYSLFQILFNNSLITIIF